MYLAATQESAKAFTKFMQLGVGHDCTANDRLAGIDTEDTRGVLHCVGVGDDVGDGDGVGDDVGDNLDVIAVIVVGSSTLR